MALLIKDPETDRLVRELANRTGESLTDAIKQAARERLERVPMSETEIARRKRRIAKLVAEIAAAPRLNEHLTPEEILGYDENGLPT